jgi:asparagine synthase (glutamine-hydrolysing)
LAHKLKLWALAKRRPWFHVFADAVRGFLPVSIAGQPRYLRPASWLKQDFVRRHRDALTGFNHRVHLRGPLPSLQTNLDTLETMRRQLGAKGLPTEPAHETRYPFLDRTLLEFLFAIPREQMLLPGYRRSLLRRALTGIVPAQILERRRKAYAVRGPRIALFKEWEHLSCLCHNMMCMKSGIVDESLFRDALIDIQNSDQIPLAPLARVIVLEAWLRHLITQGVLTEPKAVLRERETASLVVSKASQAL